MATTKPSPPPYEVRGMSVANAGKVLGLSTASVYRLITKGVLPRPRMVAGIGRRLDARAVYDLADKTWGAE